jgi:phenylalanyl-tRNA synthetase beta chain
MKISVEWVNSYLRKPLSPAELAATLERSGVEVEGVETDDVIDATTAANRWDLNGMVWLAREVAAHTGYDLGSSLPEHKSGSGAAKGGTVLVVDIGNPKLVDRYMLAHLQIDNRKSTPPWMEHRLEAAGLRSISLAVDITNYLMLELGQPLHAFDAANVSLPMGVRLAGAGETLTTLDGVERSLDPADLLITDAKGPIGLAGVMGGSNSEVSPSTTEIYLESASFNGPTLRQTAVRHGLRTDASARFERQIPVQAAPLALARAIDLLEELADAKLLAGPVDRLRFTPKPVKLAVRADRVGALLGMKLTSQSIKGELAKLGFTTRGAAAMLSVDVPWWRPDVATEEDIAEEVVTLLGYDQLPATLPAWEPRTLRFDTTWEPRWRAKAVLQSLGLFEVVTYSFISEDQIQALGRNPKQALKLKNPLSSEQAYLRTDLLPSLLRTAERNRTYSRSFKLYEFSKVYQPRKATELPHEPLHLGILSRTPDNGYRSVKAALDRLSRSLGVGIAVRPGGVEAGIAHPLRSGQLVIGDKVIGWIGQLHPAVVRPTKLGGEVSYLELDWEQFMAAARPRMYEAPSRYPVVSRDLSIIVDRTVTWQQIKAELPAESARFGGDYYGSDLPASKKAVTLRLQFSAADHTLTDAEISQRLDAAVQLLQRGVGAQVRD